MVSALMIALSASLLGVACVRPHGHQRVNPDDSNTLGLFVAQVGASGVLYSSFNRGNANVETNNTYQTTILDRQIPNRSETHKSLWTEAKNAVVKKPGFA